MPRVSKAEAEKNRVVIEQVSSRLFREQGFNGVSVADLMGAAGLTHGGFYGHFESKDALAAIACTRAFEEAEGRWRKRVADAADNDAALAALIDGYLSTRNRNSSGTGCPVAALANDVAREAVDKPVRAAFHDGVEDLLQILTAIQPGDDTSAARSKAVAQMATLAGALMLSRATMGTPLSNEILAAARTFLLAGAEPG
ncbi:TetR/AcrR family transcriptional regulator [Cupriavidus sp. SW-Y-13]|uniref:TetR/AcrR family transcriptional regulator n=1 Tax=Cupriavidus sp. SW-Y-13 TaxID=2653854 RepID=UPI001366535F|nr:TetR/AcrR family transcriptional regulator [Cupriavidus sp. SW-Y-13]MWL85829.1 TetR family transcriptional regulator [Cupriavidus sp. SW-Y-13]